MNATIRQLHHNPAAVFIFVPRASLQKNELDLASKYFEKAVDDLISAEGDVAPELISLYQEIAKIKQMKTIYEKSISYALQVKDFYLIELGNFSWCKKAVMCVPLDHTLHLCSASSIGCQFFSPESVQGAGFDWF